MKTHLKTPMKAGLLSSQHQQLIKILPLQSLLPLLPHLPMQSLLPGIQAKQEQMKMEV